MSFSHMLLIAVVALVLFGPNKLPELGRALGRTMREFKKGAEGLLDDVQASAPKEEPSGVTPRPAPDPVSEMMLLPVPSSPSEQPAQPSQSAEQEQQLQQASQAQATKPAQREKSTDARRLPD